MLFSLIHKQNIMEATLLDQMTQRVRTKRTPTLINFLTLFPGATALFWTSQAYLSSVRYEWGYAYSFSQIFQGLCLFKGVRLIQTLE